MTVLTTVGYGSHSYDQTPEYIVSSILILVAAFYSVLPYYVSRNSASLREDPAKQMLLRYDLAILDWMGKLQRQSEELYLTPTLTRDITHYIEDAFSRDHNMIVEEFDLYQKLPPKQQTLLVNEVFATFISQFQDTFFSVCEDGFKTELVIQMFYRTYQQDSEIIRYG